MNLPAHPTYDLPGLNVSTLPEGKEHTRYQNTIHELRSNSPSGTTNILITTPKPASARDSTFCWTSLRRKDVLLSTALPSCRLPAYQSRYAQEQTQVHCCCARRCVKQGELRRRSANPLVRQARLKDRADNTNRDAATRKLYIDVAKKHKISIRYETPACAMSPRFLTLCFQDASSSRLLSSFAFTTTCTGPLSRNSRILRYVDFHCRRRALTLQRPQQREALAAPIIHSFFKTLVEPSLDEGFSEIRRVNWSFQGSEEDRKRWSMWLQVEGK